MQKIHIDWEMFGILVDKLSNKIKRKGLKFDGIYGIPRGGLPIAVCLSHSLNLPLLLYPTKNSLVIDDISDTGKTLKSFKNRKIACLYSSKWTETNPDYFVLTKEDKDSWIVFPWEVE